MNQTIGIIGCGWLGFPLAKALVEENYTVHGTTTSEDKMAALQSAKILPFKLILTENGIRGDIGTFLMNLDLLIINVPPKLRTSSKENYVHKLRHLHHEIRSSTLKTVIFISSTSVYGHIDGEVTEDSPTKPITESGKQLLESENIFRNDMALHTAVVRFGGLIGLNRHPVHFLAGKSDLTNGDDPINLIHLNDCIGIIRTLIEGDYGNVIINGVYPHHPKKRDYYHSEALKKGLLVPIFTENEAEIGDKIIESRWLDVKKYQFNTSIVS